MDNWSEFLKNLPDIYVFIKSQNYSGIIKINDRYIQ